VTVDNVDKDTAITMARRSMKSKGANFRTTTKQGDEKFEMKASRKEEQVGLDRSESDDNNLNVIQPSGFETENSIPTTPLPKLIQLAAERQASGLPVFNFAVGNPSLEPPREILASLSKLSAATVKGQSSGMFKYTPPAGILGLRKFIANDVKDWQGLPNLTENQIVVTPGAQSAIVSIFEAILQPGDHVFTQTPFYPSYGLSAKLWGAESKSINFAKEDSNFNIDMSHLQKLALDSENKLRLIALCSPGNPTGKSMVEETLKNVCALAESHSKRFGRDVWILMDNTYRRLKFDKSIETPIFSFYKQSLVVSSFSKDLSLAGERVGYVAVHPNARNSDNLVRWITNNNDRLGNLSPPSLIQHVLLDVYETHGKLPSLVDIYEERVTSMFVELNRIGLVCTKPDGAFYLLPRMPAKLGTDDVKFAMLLADKGVLCVPGSLFGAAGCVRIAALPSLEEIQEACKIIEQVVKTGFSEEDSSDLQEMRGIFELNY